MVVLVVVWWVVGVGDDCGVCVVVVVVDGNHVAVVYDDSRFVGEMECFVGGIGG